MRDLKDMAVNGSLFGESVKTAGTGRRPLTAGKLTGTGIRTSIYDLNSTIAETTYFREGALAATEAIRMTGQVLFKEARSNNEVKNLYREGARESLAKFVEFVAKCWDALTVLIQKGTSWFISDNGLLKEYSAVEKRRTQLMQLIGNAPQKAFTIKVVADANKNIFSASTLLGFAADLTNPDIFVGYSPVKGEFTTGLGSGEAGETVNDLVTYTRAFKDATTGVLDADTKESVVKAKGLSEAFLKNGLTVANVFAAYLKSKGEKGIAFEKTGNARGGFAKFVTALTPIDVTPENYEVAKELAGDDGKNGIKAVLDGYKKAVKEKKTSIFFQMAKEAKEWKAAFAKGAKEAGVEKGSEQAAAVSDIATVLKTYVNAINLVAKVYTELVKDSRDAALLTIKAYNEALATAIKVGYGQTPVTGDAPAKPAKPVKPAKAEKAEANTEGSTKTNPFKKAGASIKAGAEKAKNTVKGTFAKKGAEKGTAEA